MKLFNTYFNKNNVWILLMIFPYHILNNYLLLGVTYFTNPHILIGATAITLIVWPVSWFNHTIAGFYVRHNYQEIRQTTIRVCLSLCVFIPITLAQNSLLIFVYAYWHLFGYQFNWESARALTIAGIDINIIATAVFESVYLINKWKSSITETEELKKVQIQSELENLKTQVNPHFLFNSINSLSSLIGEDPDKAEKFLSEMSKVYRYLLQNNDQELTPLCVELEFINSYYHLLKTRYEDGILMEVFIAKKYHQHLLPPLTLQMLIENAVKHNAILEKSPLRIKIIVNENEQLIVQNNIQKKTTAIESNKIGLKNIKAKYKLLNQEEVLVEENNNCFTVTIPLIKTNEYESVDC